MVPVVTRALNITNISCWKIAPKPLVYIDPITLHSYLVTQFKIESNDVFQILEYFQNFDVISSIGTSLFEVLPLYFRKSHYLKKC